MTSLKVAEVPLRIWLKHDGHLTWVQMRNSRILLDLKLLEVWSFLSKVHHEEISLILWGWGEMYFYKTEVNTIIKCIVCKLKLHKHTNKENFQGN